LWAEEEPAVVSFDQVRPVFRKHCGACHSSNRPRGDLDLTNMASIQAGSTSGPAAIAGRPDESLLYLLPAHREEPRMPPNRPRIPQRELELIRRWIEGGMMERSGAAAPPRSTETGTGSPLKVLPKPPPSAVASQPAAVADSGGPPGLLPAGVPLNPLPRRTAITALAASPRGPLVAVSGKSQVVLFNGSDSQPRTALAFPEGDVFALRFSGDGKLLLAGGGIGALSGKVVGYDVATGRRVFEVGDESDIVLTTDISPDGKLVAVGGPGRDVVIYRVDDGQAVARLRKHTDWVLSLAFSPDGLLLASGDRFGGLQVWATDSGKEFHTLRGHTGAVNAVSWPATSDRLVSAGEDGTLRTWDMHTGIEIASRDAGVGGVLALGVQRTGRVACGGRNGGVRIWPDPDSQPMAASMPDEVTEAALSFDGSLLFAADAAGTVTAFDGASGVAVAQLELPVAPPQPPSASLASRARSAEPGVRRAVASTPPPARRTEDVERAQWDADQTAAELSSAREALAAAEAAAKYAEAVAERLRALVASREAAARRAEQRLAESRNSADPDDPP
jgi:hypothetical protein